MNTAPYLRKAQFYETDQMGIIHHANYIRWMEEARTDFMEQVGYPYEKASQAGIDFAVVSVQCEYKSPVRFGDTVAIYAGLQQLTPSRMTVQYTIQDAQSAAIRLFGTSQHCYFDGNRQRPVSLLKALPELYEIFSRYLIFEKQ